jgi:hypothetical protein
MDLWKFISLIENKQLYFTKQSKFTDLHEGALNEELNTVLIKLPKPFTEFLAKSLKNMKETNRISCWKIGDLYKDAMWQTYSSKYGVAIETTVNDLELSIDFNGEILIGKILYTSTGLIPYHDYKEINEDDFVKPSFWKSKDFEHEAELRLLIDGRKTPTHNPVKIKNLDFIKFIHLSPYLEDWQVETFKRIAERFNIKEKIKYSKKIANYEIFKNC